MSLKHLDPSGGIVAITGAAHYAGSLTEYGTFESLDDTTMFFVGGAIRTGIMYKFSKELGFGIDLERSIIWNLESGIMTGLNFGLRAELVP